MSSNPDEPTPLAQLAALHHEMFTAYTDAGFTADQALYLVGQVVRASSSQSPSS